MMGVLAKILKVTGIVILGIFGAVVLMMAVGALIAPRSNPQPSASFANASPVVPTPPRPSESVTMFLEPHDLIEAYRGNELRGDARFKGKRVQVTGRVHSVDRHLGDVMIGFGSGFERVSAYIQKSEEEKAVGINKGAVNSVQCTVQGAGVMGGVMLGDCVLVGFVH
jgi:hypothetical protein